MRHFRSMVVAAVCFAGLLFCFGVEALYAGQANVFVYHRFGDSRYPSTNVSLEHFRAHLEALKEGQYEVLTLSDIVQRLQQGTPLPEKCAAITIDDGYTSVGRKGWPILQEYGYRATLFVSTQFVGGRGYLSWDELKTLQQQGLEIGNHSHTHLHMVEQKADETEEVWMDRVRQDLELSQKLFEENLGMRPELLAYPYGENTPEVQQIARELGFKAAAGQQSGVIGEKAELFNLPRFPMGGPYTPLKSFKSKLRMKPMPIEVVSPQNPILGEGPPPELRLRLDNRRFFGPFNCFVQGNNRCTATFVNKTDGDVVVQAEKPLVGRRNKYTLTAQGRDGKWYWFSYQWIQPRFPEY